MIRTRDLILFVIAFIFLAVAIAQTVLSSRTESTFIPQEIAFVTDTNSELAFSNLKKMDRDANLARLKEKIANSTELVTPSPSVESAVDSASDTSITQAADVQGVQRCLYPDDSLALVPRWPLKNVSLKVRRGSRVVVEQVAQKIEAPIQKKSTTTATSSPLQQKTVQVSNILLQLPLAPVKNQNIACVPSEVVGVTSGGVLMFNGDVNAYRKIPENILIGYARDGFPIYGVYEGEVDACGGYDSPTGYRYTISAQRDYIVGCYVGGVNKFRLQ